MGKRFTATNKWDKEWFQSLNPKIKCLWQYLCDRCDAAGVWDSNFQLASFMIGEKVTEKDFEYLGERVKKIARNKFFVDGFLEFQYGKLSPECKPHASVIKLLDRHGLNEEGIQKDEFKGYAKGMDTLQVKEQVKEKDMDMEKEKEKGLSEKKIKNSTHQILFRDSEYFDKSVLEEALCKSPPPYLNANVDYYYDAALNWSDSGHKKKIDWLATVKNWMQRDVKDGNFQAKFSNPISINEKKNGFLTAQEKRTAHNADQARRFMGDAFGN